MTDSALKSIVLALVLAGGAATLGGCNTMEGLGQDMEAAGEEIQEEAEENEPEE